METCGGEGYGEAVPYARSCREGGCTKGGKVMRRNKEETSAREAETEMIQEVEWNESIQKDTANQGIWLS